MREARVPSPERDALRARAKEENDAMYGLWCVEDRVARPRPSEAGPPRPRHARAARRSRPRSARTGPPRPRARSKSSARSTTSTSSGRCTNFSAPSRRTSKRPPARSGSPSSSASRSGPATGRRPRSERATPGQPRRGGGCLTLGPARRASRWTGGALR